MNDNDETFDGISDEESRNGSINGSVEESQSSIAPNEESKSETTIVRVTTLSETIIYRLDPKEKFREKMK